MSVPRGVRNGLFFGIASAAWVVLWSLVLDCATGGTIPKSFRNSSDNPVRDSPLIETVLARVFGYELKSESSWILAVLWVLFSALVATVWGWLRLDRDALARRAVFWAFRRTALPALGIAAAVAASLAAGALLTGERLQALVLALPALFGLVAIVLVPLAILRPEFAKGADLRWWRPKWPGGRVVVTALMVISAVRLGEWGLFRLVEWRLELLPLSLLLFVLLSVLGIALTAHILVERLPPTRSIERLRQLCTDRQRSGPWISLLAMFGLATAIVSVPALFAYLWLWQVVPVAAQLAASQAMSLPSAVRWSTSTLNLLGWFGWSALMVPAALLFDASRAHLVYLLAEERRGESASASAPAAEEPGGALSPEGRL